MSARRSLMLLALPLLAACAGAGESSWAGTVTDSAGIAIVQNPAQGAWTPDKAWKVEEVLSIGEMGGDANYQFGQIVGVDVDDVRGPVALARERK